MNLPRRTYRLDRIAILYARERRNISIQRWCNPIALITILPSCLLPAYSTVADAIQPPHTDAETSITVVAIAFTALYAGMAATSLALSTAHGSPFQPKTWTIPATLQMVGSVAVAIAYRQIPNLGGLFPAATGAISAGALLAMRAPLEKRSIKPVAQHRICPTKSSTTHRFLKRIHLTQQPTPKNIAAVLAISELLNWPQPYVDLQWHLRT